MKKKESENLYGDRFKKTNRVLKILGFIFLASGVLCEIIGLVDFFNVFASMFESPKLFFLNFVGMPFIVIGISCLSLGFRKQITEYSADQVAGVGKDLSNYMIDGTRDSITKTAQSIHNAIKANDNTTSVNICENCGERNPIDAKFCSKCGSAIIIRCPACGHEMDDGANFCNKCGYKLK